jgi:hypothetical protein
VAFENPLHGRELRDTGNEGGGVEEQAAGADHETSLFATESQAAAGAPIG